jgi:ABC-type branched-subunit amino acid transport system ATPase component
VQSSSCAAGPPDVVNERARRLTIPMAEQNFNQAIKIAARAYAMIHGRIEFEGKTAELEDNPTIAGASAPPAATAPLSKI